MSSHQTARELSRALEAREFSARELVEETFARIDSVDDRVGAFLSVADPEKLLPVAEEIDAARQAERPVPPFAGLPIAIKDNIAVEGEQLTCGSRILATHRAQYSATAVQRLQEAGLLVIGKTNMDEFGFGSSTENSAFRVTRNPRDLSRVPGGTSGGSAAAVAACMVPWALGTDTGGSVRQPASLCGVVGIRPSYGRVSRYGLVAYTSSMDQIGPIANTVDDAADLLEIVMGFDSHDTTSLPAGGEELEVELPPLTIGIPDEYQSSDCDPAVNEVVQKAIEVVEEIGWTARRISLPLTRHALSAYYLISSVEASSNLGRYDGVRYGHRAAQAETWLEMLTATRTEGFGAEAKRRLMLGTYASSSGYYDEYYENARRVRTLIIREFASAFSEVDLILSPVSPSTAWPIGERIEDPMSMYLSDVFSVPVALAGIPAAVVPVTDAGDGMPVGVQLAGPSNADSLVVSASRRVEAACEYPLGVGRVENL